MSEQQPPAPDAWGTCPPPQQPEVESAAMESISALLARTIRDVQDFPKKGIVFKDITPVLGDAATYKRVVDELVARWGPQRIDQVVGIESRGFVFAAPLAYALGAGLSIARKPGKLPWETIRETYQLEYGEDGLELHIDAVADQDADAVASHAARDRRQDDMVAVVNFYLKK